MVGAMLLTSETPTSLINTQVVNDIGNLLTTVLSWITSNPTIAIFFTLSLVGVAIGIFRGLRSAM